MGKEKYYKVHVAFEFKEIVQISSKVEAKDFTKETIQEMIGNGLWPKGMKVVAESITKEEAEKEGYYEGDEDEEDDY